MTTEITCSICGYKDEKSILSHIRNEHKISSKDYRFRFPKSRTRIAWLTGETKETSPILLKLSVINRKNRIKNPHNASICGRWSRKFDKCTLCGSSKKQHSSNGVCHNCLSNINQKKKVLNKNSSKLENGVENKDYVICLVCKKPFQILSDIGHLKLHNLTAKQYLERFPSANLTCSSVRDDISKRVSIGRIALHKRRGYLNPQSQRDSKRKEVVKRYESHTINRISKLEGTFARWLQEQGFAVKMGADATPEDSSQTIYWQYNWRNIYSLDFAQPTTKTYIEVMGDWWHGWDCISGKKLLSDMHPVQQKYIKHDENRFKRLQGDGWTIILVWEHDIKTKNWPVLPSGLYNESKDVTLKLSK